MAAPATQPASTASAPAPAAPPPTKTGFDPLRPFRYAKSFIGGTVTSTLNGMSNGGHKGMWLGAGIGTLALLSGVTGGLPLIIMGWAIGLAAGAVTGGSLGLLTGGLGGINRERRQDKYSEDLLEKAKARSKPAPRADYRDHHRAHVGASHYNLDRLYQQERENERDASTYYRDLVDNSRAGSHEKGM